MNGDQRQAGRAQIFTLARHGLWVNGLQDDVMSAERIAPMLHYALVFLVIAIIAALFGFTGIAGTAASIAKILFIVFLILAIIAFFRRAS